MKRCLLLMAAVMALSSLVVAMAAPPNLSGDWKIDVAKSDFGPFPAPEKMTTKIDHKEPAIKTNTTFSGDQGEMTFERTLSTDGTETSYQFGPMNMKSKAKWDGSTLLIESKATSDMGELTMKEKWVLSSDGKILTMESTWSSPQGDANQKIICEKQ